MNDFFADSRFRAGVEEFNAANYFEAHELWEDLWNDLIGDSKIACQGLIQIAAGYHKLAIGSPMGARKLLERGLRTLTPCVQGADWTTDLIAHVQGDLERLRAGAEDLVGDRPRLPSTPT